jgi:hypothetical protein
MPKSHLGVAGWTGGKHGTHTMEELYDAGDREAVSTVEAARQLARRAVQMALVVHDGLLANREILAGDPEYSYILEKIRS